MKRFPATTALRCFTSLLCIECFAEKSCSLAATVTEARHRRVDYLPGW